MPIHGIRHLDERLERLAFPPEEVIAEGRAPLETYTTTTSEHGDVYRATDEYVRWFHAQYPKAGTADRLSRRASSPPTKGLGGPEVSFGLEGVKDF